MRRNAVAAAVFAYVSVASARIDVSVPGITLTGPLIGRKHATIKSGPATMVALMAGPAAQDDHKGP